LNLKEKVKGDTSATTEQIINKHNGTVGYVISFNGSDDLIIELDDGTNSHTWTYTTDIRDNEFHHVVVTFAGTDVTGVLLYIDGVLVTTTEAGTYPTSTIINTIRLSYGATNAGADFFTGILDDVRFYSDVLTKIEVERLFQATDSGIDRIRDDDISTRLLSIDFNHKNHLECLRKIATELGKDIYFDSDSFTVFIRTKGKVLIEKFEKYNVLKPSFKLDNVSNIVNVLGNIKDEKQREKTFETDSTLRYTYEETFVDKQITTDDTLNLLGDTISTQLKDLNPDLSLTTTYDQYVKFDLSSGDKINLNQKDEDIRGRFRITNMIITPETAKLSLNKSDKALIQTSGTGVADIFSQLIKSIQDIQIEPE